MERDVVHIEGISEHLDHECWYNMKYEMMIIIEGSNRGLRPGIDGIKTTTERSLGHGTWTRERSDKDNEYIRDVCNTDVI